MAEPAIVGRIRAEGGPLHDLLVLLSQHQVLTAGQLARATGASARTVRQRLEHLREARLVDGAHLDPSPGVGPTHWWLRLAGARLVTGTDPVPGPRAPSRERAARAAAIAEVWLALREHAPAAGIELTGWRGDRAGWQEWTTLVALRPERRRITPDAVVQLRLTGSDRDDADIVGFVEVDLSSMTAAVLRQRATHYVAYARERRWVGAYARCPALLLLTTSETRAAAFLEVAGGLLDDDLSTADLLLVAACGLAHEPDRAVREDCWRMPGRADARRTLAGLLAERVGTAVAAARDRDDQIWWLRRAATSIRAAAQLNDDAATEALRYLAADPEGLLDNDPELAEQVLAWWAPDDGHGWGRPVDRLRRLLHQRHRQLWSAHARALLAAAEPAAGDDPTLNGMARQLCENRLLSAAQAARLDQPVRRVRTQIQRALLGGYEETRDRAVTDRIQSLGWRARRHTDQVQLAAEHDNAHLLVCDTCALSYLRRDEAGDEQHIVGGDCAYCTVGRLVEHRRIAGVPTLAERLDDLRALLP